MSMNPRTLVPSSSFSPRSISGLALWLDAADASSTYTTDAGPVTAVSSPLDIAGCALWLDGADSSAASMTLNGSLVETWKDKSGNSRDFTAASTARPTLTSNVINSRSAVTFAGSLTTMTGNTAAQDVIRNLAGYTIFTAIRTASVAGGERFAFGVGSTILFRTGQQDSRPFIGGRRLYADTLESVTDGSGTLTTGTAFIQTAVVNHSSQSLTGIRNGAAFATDATYMGAGTVQNNEAATSVGSQGGGTYGFWNGDIAEIVVFNTALTTADRARVEAYLATKWGITGVHAPATATSDPVGYWQDKSGNNRHAVQATAGSRPTISATAQNGRKALAFASQSQTVVSPVTFAQYIADATASPKMVFAWVARPEGSVVGVTFGSPTHPNSASRVFYSSDFGAAGSHIVDFGSVAGARLTGTVGDEANNVSHVYSAFRDGAVMSIRRDGVEILRKTNATGVYTDTTGTLAINTAGGGSSTASWMEFMAYAASMSASNITRIERYLAAKWGITLAPQVSNADAQNWIDRVYANGGTVTSSTAQAVNTLCESIASAGIRDRFYRLNLFCGTGLNACLVPLYRGPSLGGTQYGGATDTNVGPFVSGDYVETGSTGGLNGNGTSKYLATGLNPFDAGMVETDFHTSGYFREAINTSGVFIGCVNSLAQRGVIFHPAFQTLGMYVRIGGLSNSGIENGSLSARSGLLLGVRRPGGAGFRNGENINATSITTGSLAWNASSASPALFVFARNDATGSPSVQPFAGRSQAYSIGLSMTDQQAADFHTAMQTFQTALTRNV